VPRANAFFNISLKILFSKWHQTLKQIAIGSQMGAANCISLLWGAASLERLGSTALCAAVVPTLVIDACTFRTFFCFIIGK